MQGVAVIDTISKDGTQYAPIWTVNFPEVIGCTNNGSYGEQFNFEFTKTGQYKYKVTNLNKVRRIFEMKLIIY